MNRNIIYEDPTLISCHSRPEPRGERPDPPKPKNLDLRTVLSLLMSAFEMYRFIGESVEPHQLVDIYSCLDKLEKTEKDSLILKGIKELKKFIEEERNKLG